MHDGPAAPRDQAASGPSRNLYLSAAQELWEGVKALPSIITRVTRHHPGEDPGDGPRPPGHPQTFLGLLDTFDFWFDIVTP